MARRKVILHRCSHTWIRSEFDACRIVQNALDEADVPYEIVKTNFLRRRRSDVIRLSGQKLVPMIEFADGSAYRAESMVMGKVIKRKQLYNAAQRAEATLEEEHLLAEKRRVRWPWHKRRPVPS